MGVSICARLFMKRAGVCVATPGIIQRLILKVLCVIWKEGFPGLAGVPDLLLRRKRMSDDYKKDPAAYLKFLAMLGGTMMDNMSVERKGFLKNQLFHFSKSISDAMEKGSPLYARGHKIKSVRPMVDEEDYIDEETQSRDWLMRMDLLPVDIDPSIDVMEILKFVGFCFPPGNPKMPIRENSIFQYGNLPVGWTKVKHGTDHRKFHIKDNQGRKVAGVFYRHNPKGKTATMSIKTYFYHKYRHEYFSTYSVLVTEEEILFVDKSKNLLNRDSKVGTFVEWLGLEGGLCDGLLMEWDSDVARVMTLGGIVCIKC